MSRAYRLTIHEGNRPFNAQMVVDQLKGAVSKAGAEKVSKNTLPIRFISNALDLLGPSVTIGERRRHCKGVR